MNSKIYEYLLNIALVDSHLITFHLSPAYADFEWFYCKNIKEGRGSISRCQAKMRRYIRKLVKAGFLDGPIILGTGPGSYSEFGVRAYGTWTPTPLLKKLGVDAAVKQIIGGKDD